MTDHEKGCIVLVLFLFIVMCAYIQWSIDYDNQREQLRMSIVSTS